MSIILYKGARGKSKTLTMVKDGIKYLNCGWSILTNLSNTRFKKIDSAFILALSSKSTLKNCVLVIDEIELFFDSREWNKDENKTFSKFLQQIRKRNIVILCTAQFSNLIDIRLRQQIDKVVLCNYDDKLKISTSLYIDLTSCESVKKPKNFSISFYAEPIFKEYNTLEIIN